GDRNARDKVYSRWGGFLEEVPFDPTSYGIPPRSMKSIDPMQLLALEVARRTLADAGYAQGGFDRENTSIILGAGGGLGDLGLQYGVRAELPRFVENPDPGVWERLPEWTEESFAGTLLNVAAGRVANRMDFGGLNFTIDAACASSLAAINVAVSELESGRSSMVLAGGIDTVQSPFGYLCFSKTQALSPTGRPKTFDESADGIAISEGLAVVALKRLADAEADGDRIYAVIKAVAGSSDGKALGLTAPRPDGQIRALKRAYAKAGFSPSTLGLFEAHGTGTAVGDRAEAETITRALKNEGAAPRSVALGSVKTILGHTKASAGVSGLIKVALSLYHRVQPGHHGVEKPIAAISDPASPVALFKDARPWIAHPRHPRRAGVSAFGFGGTNFHAVLEEYAGAHESPGADRWPHELCVFRAENDAALIKDLEQVLPGLVPGSRVALASIGATLARRAKSRGAQPVTLALVAADHEALKKDITAVLSHLRESKPLPPHIRLNRTTPAQAPETAFLFPGQGAQYTGMGREAALYFDDVRTAVELADRQLADRFPDLLSRTILPASPFDADIEKRQTAELTRTSVAQPAIGAVSLGYLRLARRLGLSATATAGHSYGEYGALCAAGVIGEADLLELSAVRGAAMEQAAQTSLPGTMAAVQGAREAIAAALDDFPGVRVANHNAPQQSVISGPREAVVAACTKLEGLGMRATPLPVSGAFHTDLVAAAQEPLAKAIRACRFHPPAATVYSNSAGKAHAREPAEIRAAMENHLLSSVEFVAEIEAMYAAGCRVFVELGPKSLTSNMVKQILSGRDHVAVSLDGNGGGLRGLLQGLAELFVAGTRLDAMQLFAARDVAGIEISQLGALALPQPLPSHVWMVSGGAARPLSDPIRRTGREPALTRAAVDAARAKVAAAQAASPSPGMVAPATAQPIPAAPAPAMVPVPATMGTEALVAYQQTMRQFLALQEKVMQQMLGGMPMPAAPAPALAPLAAPAPPPPAPIQVATIVTPAAAPAKAPIAVVQDFDAPAILLEIVCQRTGYPAEMLALDADLEADLGVDSIKRVEILGALRKALPSAQATAMQAAMEQFTKARSISAILRELVKLGGATTIAAPAPTAVAPAAVDHTKLLIGIVADRTGYPADMLALDADLEADLGVDSIKRVEIIGALRKAVSTVTAAAMQDAMEKFTKARSLKSILAELDKLAVPATVADAPLAPAAPAAAAAPIDYMKLLTGIVAERTGYPAEMLTADADLEADLGVDSIKRVEILGALRKALPAAQSAAMQASMEKYTKARSLKAIVAECLQLAPATAPAPAVAAATATATAAADLNLRSLLTGIVAERTGYPAEMLSAGADLEADLGIDSIKRVEILGALRKALPAGMAEQMRADMERYTKARTLDAILAQLSAVERTPLVAASATLAVDTAAPAAPAVLQKIPRFVIKPQPAPLAETAVQLQGLALVFGGPRAIVDLVQLQLEACGLTPVGIDAVDGEIIAGQIAQAQQKHGPARAVLHLHGLTSASPQSLGEWRNLGQHAVYSLFHAARALDQGLNNCRVIVGTRLGGTFGRDAVGSGAPLAGGACGITNCLRYEYPSAHFRAVDFDGQSDAEIAQLLVAELHSEDRASEAGYIGSERYGSITELQPLTQNPFAHNVKPQKDWVLLVTGGARGITAEIIDELACDGLRLVLLGRTAEPAAEALATRPLKSTTELRQHLTQQALGRGEKPKPVDIDRAVSALLAEREIRDNLARLRAKGCIVDYIACDVRDERSLGQVIDDVYAKHGRLDGVIHGAGVIEDRLIRDKTEASFARVFGTKLDPVFVLQSRLKADSLKFLALFASVAGRYGNRGQSDYAAANEALNRLAWSLSRAWPQTRVMAINWGPWDAGMASDGVKKQFRERGIEPIAVAAGRRFFVEELEFGSRNHVELVAGEGPWGAVTSEPPAAVPAALSVPLVRGDLRLGPGGSMTLDHTYSLGSDPYLADHKLDGKPVLPATGALEWIAQFAAAAWPTWQVSEIRDLRVLNGIVLDGGGDRNVQLRARASTHSDPGEQAITVEIVDLVRKLPCYRATVILAEQLAMAAAQTPSAIGGTPFDPARAYREYLF
ncbi:MAG TPA: SDR family NAD(P)-dependent oxidoreductase, partial [Nevskiaceae bacterium]|nr:SDR family NAD(P)-dependent oxidoreductase [Nevskiaceae bacterium]